MTTRSTGCVRSTPAIHDLEGTALQVMNCGWVGFVLTRGHRGDTFGIRAERQYGRSETEHLRHTLRIPVNAPDAISLVLEVELRSGQNRISVGVLDEQSGETGFAVAEVDVPELDPPTRPMLDAGCSIRPPTRIPDARCQDHNVRTFNV